MGLEKIFGVASRDIIYALTLSGMLVVIIMFLLAMKYFLVEPWGKRRRVAQRLSEASQQHFQQIRLLKEKLESRSDKIAAVFGTFGQKKIAALQGQMLKADILWDPLTFIGVLIFAGMLGFFFGILGLKSFWGSVLLACGAASIPYWYLRRKKKRKTSQFEAQLPDAMELLARSLRAGHTLPSAIELLSTEVAHPLGTEMQISFEEQRFGISMAESLVHMVERVDSLDLKYFVTAVLIQQETGGNLVELVEKIGQIIRARINFKMKIRSLSADGRLSAMILGILPIFMFLLLFFLRPEYEAVLIHEEFGRKLLLGAAVSMLAGLYVMNKLIKAIEA